MNVSLGRLKVLEGDWRAFFTEVCSLKSFIKEPLNLSEDNLLALIIIRIIIKFEICKLS